jgi:hypothetical protein
MGQRGREIGAMKRGVFRMLTAAICLQVLLLLYYEATTLIDLFPFNAARFCTWKEKGIEATMHGVMMSVGIVGFAGGMRGLMWFGVIYYFVLFLGEAWTWWVPYFWGPTEWWRKTYERIHSRTITILPARGGNPIPNLEHMILNALTLAAAVATCAAFARHK